MPQRGAPTSPVQRSPCTRTAGFCVAPVHRLTLILHHMQSLCSPYHAAAIPPMHTRCRYPTGLLRYGLAHLDHSTTYTYPLPMPKPNPRTACGILAPCTAVPRPTTTLRHAQSPSMPVRPFGTCHAVRSPIPPLTPIASHQEAQQAKVAVQACLHIPIRRQVLPEHLHPLPADGQRALHLRVRPCLDRPAGLDHVRQLHRNST